MSEINTSNNVPFSMWQVFHNTIIKMFKNLDNAENNLRMLVNTLLTSKEFWETLVPKQDTFVTFEDNVRIEKQYEAFTTWLLGRLFYLLSCNKLEKSHDLFVETQIKILDVLQIHQPHMHLKFINEYSKVLTQLLELKKNNQIVLNNFIPDNTVINQGELDLTPELVKIDNEHTSTTIQKYVLKILTKTVFTYIIACRRDKIINSVLDNFLVCLEKSKSDKLLIVLNFFIKVINMRTPQSKLDDYFIKVLHTLEQLIFNYHLNSLYFNLSESRDFEAVVQKLFVALCENNEIILQNNNIRKKCFEICNFYVTEAVKSKDNTKEIFLESVCKLFRVILEHEKIDYTSVNNLIDYVLMVRTSTFGFTLIEYQILFEIKSFIKSNDCNRLVFNIDVVEVSPTWLKLSNEIDFHFNFYINRPVSLSVLCEFFNMLKNIFKSLRKIYFDLKYWKGVRCSIVNIIFIDVTQFLIKIRQVKDNIKNFTDSLECIMSIVLCLPYIISVMNMTKQNEVEYMIIFQYLCYPFIGKVTFPSMESVLTGSNINDYPDEILVNKQIESLKVLSVSMTNCGENEWKNFLVIRQWIINILKYCVEDQNSELCLEVARCLPYFINTWQDEEIIHVLHSVMKMTNANVVKCVVDNIKLIVCQTVGKTSVVRVIDDHDQLIYYKIYCRYCDLEVVENNFMKIPTINIKVQEPLTTYILLKYFLFNDDYVKLQLVSSLPRFSNHIKDFHSIETTNQWLNYITDESHDVRKMLTKVFGMTIQNMQNNPLIDLDLKKRIFKICLQSLVDATLNYFVHCTKVDMQKTTLELIRQIGQLQEENVLFVTVRLLIIYLILGKSHIPLIAVDVLHQIAKAHNLTPNEIYTKYKKHYCETIAGMVIFNFSSRKLSLAESLKKVLPAFDFTTRDFLSRDGHHILPCFLTQLITSPNCQPILTEIADLLMTDPSEILISKFANIYPHLYLNQPPKFFKQSMDFIVQTTKTSESTLRKRNLQLIHNELLVHFHSKRDLVLKAIYELSKDNSGQSVISNQMNLQEIADGLNPRFLGILVYFDSKLVSKRVCDEVKTNVLLSLPDILKLMGTKYITPLRLKVLATLRTALTLTEDPYPKLSCEAWEAFVHCVEPESLGSLLSTIFISLLPLLKLYPQKINNSIFKYLLIENEEKVKDHIQDLFFLQEIPVKNEFKNVVEKHINKPKNFLEQIDFCIKIITHENIEVVLYGLQYLKRLLAEKRLEIDKIILGCNGMSGIIVELIDILISGCRKNDEKIRLACSECIGELGAIEPSHFPRKYISTESHFTFYISDDTFVVNALMELIRAFQMEKHTQNMNRYALAIQEMLKVYGVSPEENAPKSVLWNNFPDNIKELMLPLLSSRYTVVVSSDKTIGTHPIYGSNLGLSFKEWIYNWTSHLISIIKNDKQSLLQVCKPSLKQDHRTLMFFLPHILIHAILESTEFQRNQIFNEFISILNSDNQKKLDKTQLKFRPLRSQTFTNIFFEQPLEDHGNSEYMKVIFLLLDYLDRWTLEWESKSNMKQATPMSNAHYQHIKKFMSQFCKLKIANCNYVREEYPRALLYLEKYVSEDKTRLNSQLEFLAKIYTELEEPDGVAGALALKQTEPSLEEMILAHRLTDQLQDIAACYERVAQETILKPEYLHEMIRCYLELDNPHTAYNIAQGAMETHSDYKTMLYELQAESFWRQNAYDKLEELLMKPELQHSTSWGVSIGMALQHFRLGQRDEFKNKINDIRKTLTEMLTVTSIEEGVYRHGYRQVIKLHILNELQKADEMVYKIKDIEDRNKCEEIVNNLIEEWDLRLKIIQPTVRVYEPVLRLRRIILEQSQILIRSEPVRNILNKHISKYWLKSAEIAVQAGIFQQAYIYLLKAEKYKPLELFIEKAKFYWAKEEQELAFGTLKRGIEEHFPDYMTFKDMDPLLRKTDRKLCAEAKLLIAMYNDETANVGVEMNISNYKESTEIYKEWEKSLVCLAQYYDKIFSTLADDDKDVKNGEIQIHIINCFGKSLQYGSTYIYQSMPRILSIWFDYGTRIIESRPTDDNNTREIKKNNLYKMIKLMDTYLDRLPAYMFLSAFSQLVSRICHPVREVYLQIKSILIKLILQYPQQCMWMLLAISKSAYAMRTKRCQEILQDQRLKNSSIMRLIYDFNRLAEKLIELCNKPLGNKISVTSISSVMRALPRLLQSKDFSEIILPIEKFRKMFLPNPELANTEHEPFPNAFVYIAGIEDEIQVLASLQRPRKIAFRGSDGKRYIHMLKARDDLRKDFRLMEFNDVVNLYLHREAESRQKRLYIRTYSVVPLNEECGIIEWVENLVGLRPVLLNMYKQKGIYVGGNELKMMICSKSDSLSKKRQVFQEKLLPKHPAILSEWFRRKFPDAHHWYQARTAYIRTAAVISMVGYILGLGDRHGENVLFDSTNGDTVHVDFNCLFNKGESFDWPERVPFRLTHNMIEAMGPLGVEGIFRKSSAVTLRILRLHTDTLMSIVKPFVYDPLLSWPRNQSVKSEQSEAERTNEQAMEHIRNIELRLKGSYKSRGKTYSVPLSCEGQVNNLILEATNIDNLSQMYIGWGPFL